MKKLPLLLSLLLCVALNACSNCGNKWGNLLSATDTDSTKTQDSIGKFDPNGNAPAEVSLAFVGDVMMGTNFPDSSYITKDRGRSLFKDCAPYIKAADLAIANLEGTMYYGTEGELRKMTNPKTYYIFRMPGDHAQNLVDAGFDAVGIANNHSNDFGITGRKLTLANLRSVGLGVSGVKEMAEECLIERNGVTFGFLQFAAACTNTLDLNNEAEVKQYVTALRKKCDVLIVTFHGGAEGTAYLHVPMAEETYVGERRGNVAKFARLCVDLGADIVVGHGPHVPRGMEIYKNHLIAYSLGNFCTPFRMGVSGTKGLAPLLVARVRTDNGAFAGGQIHSYRQQERIGPRTDATNEAARLINQLSQADFPQSAPAISPEGVISPK